MPDPQLELAQVDVERWFREKWAAQPWTHLYRYVGPLETGIGIYCGLMPVDFSSQALENADWDIQEGRVGPSLSYGGTYLRNTNLHGIEPIVIARDFHKRRPNYVEISEELKLLFNLYEDRESGTYFLFEDDGSETLVIRTSSNLVEVRTSFIRRYLAARQMALLMQIDSTVWLPVEQGASVPPLPEERGDRSEEYCFEFWSGRADHFMFSRLLGKKIMRPPETSKSEIWPFSKSEQYADFIVGEDQMGHPIRHTCDPMRVPGSHSVPPDQPNKLTPIFFKREVLRKYLSDPDRYLVGDGVIRCDPVWLLRADTAHPNHVSAYLGDLGTDLPTSEQKHWQAYELPPVGLTQSEVAFRRSILGEYASSELPEHRFKRSYAETKKLWLEAFGWSIYKDLHEADRHVLVGLHSPLQNTHSDFDQQLLNLAKVMVDSLNEEGIVARLAGGQLQKGDQGIAKVERLLGPDNLNYPFVARDMTVLRTIQGVRSRGAAHRKGTDYDLAKAGLDPQDLQGSFNQLLNGCIRMLDDLGAFTNQKVQQELPLSQ